MRPAPLARVLLSVLASWSVAVGTAEQAKAADFGIASFSLEAVSATTVINEGPGQNCDPCHIENVPYSPLFTTAGGHPWAIASTVVLNRETLPGGAVVPTRDPKDFVATLPAGLLGNPIATPRCPLKRLIDFANGQEPCPSDTQLGYARVVIAGGKTDIGPIVNVEPETGQTAEFGLETPSRLDFLLTAHLAHNSKGYSVTVVDNGVPTANLTEAELTFWGVPADSSHNQMRGLECATSIIGSLPKCEGGGESSGVQAVPFLSWPTDCSAGAETATLRADSWEEPGRVLGEGRYEGYAEAQASMPGVEACNVLKFDPRVEVLPDTPIADEPVGLGVNVDVPQSEGVEVPVTPQVRDVVGTLPAGLSVSPGVADGVEACDESGPHGINITGPESEEVGPSGELQLAPGHCPDASILGTAEAFSPLLDQPVKGHVYLARPGCGATGQPACTESDAVDGNLYKLYLELGGTGELANAGVNVKVVGETAANPATGQLTTSFLGNPQLPFSELRVRLDGGPRAPLANPSSCADAVSTFAFTPWSATGETPEGRLIPGTPAGTSSSHYAIEGCPSVARFTPGFAAGTVTPQAGQFSAFTMKLTREDREPYLRRIQVRLPQGLSGLLSSVPLCQEPAAAQGLCPESTKIGTTRVAAGAGSHPFEIGGSVYLTSSYEGAPFGLSVVTHATAGPFNLGLVVVRARIDVDQNTAQVTVTSDPLPQIVFGVPLRLKQIVVDVDRPGFMFNPTNCGRQEVTAVITGDDGTRASVSSPFAVGGCRGLAFKPKFSVTTSGRTSKLNGASLDSKLAFPAGSFGTEANIAKVKVSLPKQLPSRLTTLQMACVAAVFETNPAQCPSQSIIGIARTSTPVLQGELEGPVYFVSHGGEQFPSLVAVLEGKGVRVDLTGSTFISKAGITSTTFRLVPDVPVNSFELFLPEGRFSALGAIADLCHLTKLVTVKRKVAHRTVSLKKRVAADLRMPTEFVAQNGAVFKQQTKIVVTDCSARSTRSAGRARRAGHSARRSQ